MSNLFEGDFNARAVKPDLGAASNGKPKIRVEFEIVDGDRKGTRVSYDGKLDAPNIKYTKRNMIAIGWQGKDVGTFVADVMKAARTVPIRTRIARYTRDDGSVSEWTSVDRIGYAAAELGTLDKDKIADVNRWFAEADDGDAPSAKDDSIPF